jgi:hypothetical protein
MILKLACLVTVLGVIGCHKKNDDHSSPKNVEIEVKPEISYVISSDQIESVQCSGLSLGGPSCESIASVTKAFDNIVSVSGAAALTCAIIPDPVISKGLAIGFAALGAQSKFTSFILGNIPCEATLNQSQKDEIARQVEAVLKSKGIKVEGPITIPDKK